MVSTIRYSANASSDHHPNQVPGILIIMNPKQPNLPTCSMTSTYLLFHLLSNPSLHLIANTTLGIIMTAIKNQPKNIKPFHIIYHHKFRFVTLSVDSPRPRHRADPAQSSAIFLVPKAYIPPSAGSADTRCGRSVYLLPVP